MTALSAELSEDRIKTAMNRVIPGQISHQVLISLSKTGQISIANRGYTSTEEKEKFIILYINTFPLSERSVELCPFVYDRESEKIFKTILY
jgi:hypothetical protein